MSRSRTVMARAGFLRFIVRGVFASTTHWPRNSGRYFSTGSPMRTLPSSTRSWIATAVTGLVIDITWKIESGRIGFLASMSCQPEAS